MNLPSQHYHQLVGLNQDGAIADVQLDVRNKTLTHLWNLLVAMLCAPSVGLRVR